MLKTKYISFQKITLHYDLQKKLFAMYFSEITLTELYKNLYIPLRRAKWHIL